MVKSGKAEGLPYSLSRWTDLPSAKWGWFKEQLAQGYMVGFDPRTNVPAQWSLEASAVQGLIFWTKDPSNLIEDSKLLRDYPMVVHMTLTGWREVEKGAPDILRGIILLRSLVEEYGPEKVVWRFSPIPHLSERVVLDRFAMIALMAARVGLKKVYVAFLQDNDRMPEPRSRSQRQALLCKMADVAKSLGMNILLCQDDLVTLANRLPAQPENLKLGVCEDGRIFGGEPPVMDCGCALSVDPFTVNESCTMGCAYCYAADQTLAPKKRNTTKRLSIIR